MSDINLGHRHFEALFMGVNHGENAPRYPMYLHLDGADALLVHNTEEDLKARADGYDNMTAAAMSNRYLVNWFWDLEDMSPRQLRVFAQDEYGIDLPEAAGQEVLFNALCELIKYAPQNQNRMVMMAHTISMQLDTTMEEIKRMNNNPDASANVEHFSEEVWL
uniref:Uncharacterized protein n=1 Tax=viral metagenome TaxID=1070528 RepID=A0A6M3KFT6_9ZZZZ